MLLLLLHVGCSRELAAMALEGGGGRGQGGSRVVCPCPEKGGAAL